MVTVSLTASTEVWCAEEWVIFTCRAQGINGATSLGWMATGYFKDVYALSTGHAIGTRRPVNAQPGQTFAILTYKGEMMIESKLHVLVKNSTYTMVTCTVNPPGISDNITRSEGVYMQFVILYSGKLSREKLSQIRRK